MKTNGIGYIGSKSKIIPHILNLVKRLNITSVIDVCSGSTRVAQAFKQEGYSGITSDLLKQVDFYNRALLGDVRAFQLVLNYLNDLKGYQGYITENYCMNGKKYWTFENGMKADAIRDAINNRLEYKEDVKKALLGILLLSLDKVTNTCGLQSGFLKEYNGRALGTLKLVLPPHINGKEWKHLEGDAFTLPYPKMDLAYIDPPYTSADYGNNYKVYEDLIGGNPPKSKLNKGLLTDMVELFTILPTNHIMLSYNDCGSLSLDDIYNVFRTCGAKKLTVQRIPHKKYMSSYFTKDDEEVNEYLFLWNR